jgi:hypothetical protein
MIKFPIFVFLDGKDTDGNDVRPRILGTTDDFRIYRLLYDSLLLTEFLESYPPIPIKTEIDIMCELNNFSNENTKMFEEEQTSMNSSNCSSECPSPIFR